jgi:hypothetical protein
MTAGGELGRTGDFCYSVEVTRHGRFQATAAALAVRTAEHVGCAPARARQMGEALDRVLGWLIERPVSLPAGMPEEAPGTISIEFRGRDGEFTVDVSCSDEAPLSLPVILERVGALAAVSTLVDAAEIADANGRRCCRLTCRVDAH